ncbi:GNAT family N-acetyltransferase [uncultured Pseudokineococcus sp.]|uniref:GNAT family N-acetyltransferase n=1 Tax=uncultured Pseudokineococcus sp. TaxID=1642928 RepID=UPI0026203412|nr:GNAT family N-acetyltransferase [uncultured Pseudokineococcus sp.]
MTAVLRTAGPDDVAAVVALVQRAYRGEASRAGWTTEADLLDGQRTDAAAVGALVAAPGSAVLLLEEDGRLVACCHVEARSPAASTGAHPAGTDPAAGGTTGEGRLAYVGMVAVDPAHQGAGTGRAVLAGAEAHARDSLGATDLEMTVLAQRAELVAWYERRGWSRTGERRPFPYGDERFGRPRREDLEFVVLARSTA